MAKSADDLYKQGQSVYVSSVSSKHLALIEHKAAVYFWQAASLGHLKAAYDLFTCFNEGSNGVEKDISIASFWFAVATKLKDSRCKINPYPFSLPSTLNIDIENTTKAIINAEKLNLNSENLNSQLLLIDNYFPFVGGMKYCLSMREIKVEAVISYDEKKVGYPADVPSDKHATPCLGDNFEPADDNTTCNCIVS